MWENVSGGVQIELVKHVAWPLNTGGKSSADFGFFCGRITRCYIPGTLGAHAPVVAQTKSDYLRDTRRCDTCMFANAEKTKPTSET
jgi:hypothetical protein